MTLKEKIARLFGRGKGEKRTFVVFFRHSQRRVEFEGTWGEIKRLSKRFGGERGLKMDNFFVPWGEVASIYEKDPEEEAPKAEGEEPEAREARELGAESMEAIEDPKDAPIDGAKASAEEGKEIKAEKI